MRKDRFILCGSGNGFALVVTLVLMVLIAILAVALSGLAAIELRRSSQNHSAAVARANARLALIHAIGQLQRNLGPDQRVSATAGILPGNPEQPHWTGVWRSTQDDGTPFFKRDDLAGGLTDLRANLTTPLSDRVMEWLVSGKGNPATGAGTDSVLLARDSNDKKLEVPKVVLKNELGDVSGHHAWWTGDLGVRANLASRDPRHDQPVGRGKAGGDAWYRLMASPAADASMMSGEVSLADADIRRLATAGTTALTSAGKDWSELHTFDFTTHSLGVLADVARGGLKRDLTAFFASSGDIPPFKNLPGLAANDPLVGDQEIPNNPASRYAKSGPRFGLLRDWAKLGAPFSGKGVSSRLTECDPSAAKSSETLALANEQPVKLAGNSKCPLQPILVEATNFTQMSTYPLQGGNYQLRQLMYPRVVLWNPYNVELKSDSAIIMIQGNGRQELNTKTATGGVVQWISFEGGRNANFENFNLATLVSSTAYNDPYMGSYYFSIPATTYAPGECLVFSPAKSAEYDGFSYYRRGFYNLNENVLSCTVQPDPSRSYYVSGSDVNEEGFRHHLVEFWYAPSSFFVNGQQGVGFQSDDTRAILKSVGSQVSTVTFDVFDSLPQLAVLSASLQYGAGKEPRLAWSKFERMPMEVLDRSNPKPTIIPNVRTREGIRLRWFDEHPSNQLHAGRLYRTAHFEEALLANWNPRGSFSLRSPWENIAGNGEPWFFGAYTRDLFDQAVSWDEQQPVLSGGRCHGNPFGPPQEGAGRYVLFDVPRKETGVVSLGQLQHAKLSELIWHPSYAIGNSLVDPRLASSQTKGLARSAAVASDPTAAKAGGFHEKQLGWSNDAQRAKGRSDWANTAKAILGDVPVTDNLVYDLSFEANHNVWDRYFLSSGSPAEKAGFLSDPGSNSLPNARMKLIKSSAKTDELNDFHQAASILMVDGAFNVNSTSVEAWKALLGSTRLAGYGTAKNIPFPRVLDPPKGAWKNGDSTDSEEVWAGYRELTREEIQLLAEAIVREVKKRGPFISLADFVNRRLADDDNGRMGALQAAIEKSGLNSSLVAAYPLNNKSSLPDYRHADNIADATLMEQTLKPDSKAWGAPSWLTQADILQALGPCLTARSDSFVIRSYGDAVGSSGKVTARAWCEAVVQRIPEPLDPDDSGLNPRLGGKAGDFGRRFIITSFRWLTAEEI